MRTLNAYNFITLNGFFRGPQEDISWHTHGGEEEQYSVQSLQGDGILLFGRKTYDMMASFWPKGTNAWINRWNLDLILNRHTSSPPMKTVSENIEGSGLVPLPSR